MSGKDWQQLPPVVWVSRDTSNSDTKQYVWVDRTRADARQRQREHKRPMRAALSKAERWGRRRLARFRRCSDFGSPHPAAPFGYYVWYPGEEGRHTP